MARRSVKLLSWASVALAASGICLYGNKYLDPSDFGAVRVGRAVATTAAISYDYLTSLRGVPYGSEEYAQLQSQVHLRSARRLRELCCANRGTFIKVGQHLGALDYLLPPEYTHTLRALHSQAPCSSLAEVQQVIREELGQEVQDLFQSFDDTPLGAASLAQVHKAVLHDGRTVAVKVQHPKVQAQSSTDILLMQVLVQAVKWLFPDFEFIWLVDEAKKNLPLELDFLNEGRNAEKVAAMLKHFEFLKVPRIHWDLSTKRLLLMEFLDGGQVNDRAYMERNGLDVNQISRRLGKMYSEMIFVSGFVHCDPHPGNVLVRRHPDTGEAQIILLDHGLYQVLTEEFRLDYCHLWHSLIRADMKQVEKYSQRLGAGELYPLFACILTARSWASVTRGIGQAPVTAAEDREIRANAASYLPEISRLLNRVPRQLLLLLKTNDLLRGTEAALGTRASAGSFLSMARCCVRALAAHERSQASLLGRTRISLRETLSLWGLSLQELLLRVSGLQLARRVGGPALLAPAAGCPRPCSGLTALCPPLICGGPLLWPHADLPPRGPPDSARCAPTSGFPTLPHSGPGPAVTFSPHPRVPQGQAGCHPISVTRRGKLVVVLEGGRFRGSPAAVTLWLPPAWVAWVAWVWSMAVSSWCPQPSSVSSHCFNKNNSNSQTVGLEQDIACGFFVSRV